MTICRIDILCACDACQKRFGVEIDRGEEPEDYETPTWQYIVEEAIRGGQATTYTWGVRGKATVDRFALSYSATIQGDLLLCDDCSKKCDDLPIERNLTREEVRKCLGLSKDFEPYHAVVS